MTRFYYILFLLSFYSHKIYSYNFEERIPIIKVGDDGSLFGLSVAEHFVDLNSGPILIVGAPKQGPGSWHDAGISEPGGLFKCQINQAEQCERVAINIDQNFNVRSNSSNQWLGVTVESQRKGGKVAVCAHRYTERDGRGTWSTVSAERMLGRCFILDKDLRKPDDTDLNFEWSPCMGLVDNNGVYSPETYGYCQAGTSVAFADSEDEDFLIGAPGSFSWTGALYADQLAPTKIFADQVWSQNMPDPSRVNSLRNSNLGFSLATGRLSNSEKHTFVAGSPRANDTGSVTIFMKDVDGFDPILKIHEVVYGERIASSFGYEVQVYDINGDGRDDLIVGAPQYFDPEGKVGGAVYIYLNKGTDTIGNEPTQILYGKPESSFGLSITNLGDINMDGANDTAIGAPAEDGWKGAVYIYHGYNLGTGKAVYDEVAQAIKPEQLLDQSKMVKGFGYSVSGGMDMDGNEYPDLAVGSLSDQAILFRTRPIINIASSLSSTSPQVTADLHRADTKDKEQVIYPDGHTADFVVFDVKICLNYTSPTSFDSRVNVRYNITLDSTRWENDLPTRVTFDPLISEGSVLSETVKLYKQSSKRNICKTHQAYLRNDIQDKLSPINITVVYETVEDEPTLPTSNTLPSLPPILSRSSRSKRSADMQIDFSKNCGDDGICESRVSWNAHYIMRMGKTWVDIPTENDIAMLKLGEEEELGMIFNVKNEGEDAHQARLRITLPEELQFVNVERADDKTAVAPSYKLDPDTNQTVYVLQLGNPLVEGAQMSIRIKLAENEPIYQSTGFNTSLQFTTTSLQSGHDQIRYFKVKVRVEAKLEIDGYPDQEQVEFGGSVIGESAVKIPEDAGVIIRHTYEVKNSGTSPASDVRVHILWPQAIKNEKWLFYLLEASVKQNGGTCTLPEQVNPLNLKFSSSGDPTKPKRLRRDADEEVVPQETKSIGKTNIAAPQSSSVVLNCSEGALCAEIVCDLGLMPKDTIKFVYLYAILWNSTFLEEYFGVAKVEVWSSARVSIDRKNIEFSEGSSRNISVVTSVLSEEVIPPEPEIAWWIIAAACAAGIILLVGMVLLLWMCGFFKRKRYDTHKARRRKQASKKEEESERLY